MDKNLIKKILTSKKVELEDVNKFIVDYVLFKKNKNISAEELNGILTLINNGIFDLRRALIDAANSVDLTVLTAFDKKGIIINTYVY